MWWKRKNIPEFVSNRDFKNSDVSSLMDVLGDKQKERDLRIKIPELALKEDQTPKDTFDGEKTSSDTKVLRIPKNKSVFTVNNKEKVYCKESLYFFTKNNRVRQVCVLVTCNWGFKILMKMIVLIQFVILADYDYNSSKNTFDDSIASENPKNIFLTIAESCFLFEGILLVIARGFSSDSKSFIYSLDCLLSLVGFLGYVTSPATGIIALSSLRMYRLTKIPKKFSFFADLHRMRDVLKQTSVEITILLSVLGSVVLLFSIIGLNLWSGILNYRCRYTAEPQNGYWEVVEDWNHLCGVDMENCPTGTHCGSNYDYPDYEWAEDFDIQAARRDILEFYSFQNILTSVLTNCAIVQVDNWYYLNNRIREAWGSITTTFYFIGLIFMSSFFLNNFLVAVMLDYLSKTSLEKDKRSVVLAMSPRSKGNQFRRQSTADISRRRFIWSKTKAAFKSFEKYRPKCFKRVDIPNDEHLKDNWSAVLAFMLINQPVFNFFIYFLILLNILVLSLDPYPPYSTGLSSAAYIINLCITIIFAIEALLKFHALDIKKFTNDAFNIYEALVALLGIIDVIIFGMSSAALSVLRGFRLFKIVFLIKKLETFKILVEAMFMNLKLGANFLILDGIFIMSLAAIGKNLYQGNLGMEDDAYQSSFDTFPESIVSVLQIVTSENYSTLFFNCIESVGWPSFGYFFFVVCFGRYILSNLFLAMLLHVFEETRKKQGHKIRMLSGIINKFKRKVAPRPTIIRTFSPRSDEHSISAINPDLDQPQQQHPKVLIGSFKNIEDGQTYRLGFESLPGIQNDQIKQQEEFLESQANLSVSHRHKSRMGSSGIEIQNSDRQIMNVLGFTNMTERSDEIKVSRFGGQLKRAPSVESQGNALDMTSRNVTTMAIILPGNEFFCSRVLAHMKSSSLFLFPYNSPVRNFFIKVIEHRYWEYSIILIILVTCVVLAIDDPLGDPDSLKKEVIQILDIIFTLIFFFEFLMTASAYGVFYNFSPNKKAYFGNIWNILDFIVLVASIGDIISNGESSELKSVKSLRALRALKPLKFVSRNESMKLSVNALFSSIPPLMSLIVTCFIILMVGAIIGMKFFKGTFYSCIIDSSLIDLVKTKENCLELGGEWLNAEKNFDNIFNSLLSLAEMSTGEAWVELKNSANNSVGIDMQPIENNRPWASFIIVGFMMFGTIILFNLFIGVAVDNFKMKKQELSGISNLNEDQRLWAEIQKIFQRKRLIVTIPVPEKNKYRMFCYRVVNSPNNRFEYFIVSCIILNVMVMGLTFTNNPKWLDRSIDILNNIFLGLFHLEAGLRIMAHGLYYFKDNFNRFDFGIVVLSDVFLVVSRFSDISADLDTLPTVLRALRIGKLVRIIRWSKYIQLIIDTMFLLFSSTLNIVALFLLLTFIFAILGLSYFSNVKPVQYVNEFQNFQNILNSMVTLFQCATGENWDLIMEELARSSEGCVDDQSYEEIQENGVLGCGTFISYPYFMSFFVLVRMIVINLILAIITEGYSDFRKETDAAVTPAQVKEVFERWAEYDPSGTGFIKPEEFIYFLNEIHPPVGLKKENPMKYDTNFTANPKFLVSPNRKVIVQKDQKFFKVLKKFNLPLRNHNGQWCVHFSDVITQVTRRVIIKMQLSIDDLEISSKDVIKALKSGWVDSYPELKPVHREERRFTRDLQKKLKDMLKQDELSENDYNLLKQFKPSLSYWFAKISIVQIFNSKTEKSSNKKADMMDQEFLEAFKMSTVTAYPIHEIQQKINLGENRKKWKMRKQQMLEKQKKDELLNQVSENFKKKQHNGEPVTPVTPVTEMEVEKFKFYEKSNSITSMGRTLKNMGSIGSFGRINHVWEKNEHWFDDEKATVVHQPEVKREILKIEGEISNLNSYRKGDKPFSGSMSPSQALSASRSPVNGSGRTIENNNSVFTFGKQKTRTTSLEDSGPKKSAFHKSQTFLEKKSMALKNSSSGVYRSSEGFNSKRSSIEDLENELGWPNEPKKAEGTSKESLKMSLDNIVEDFKESMDDKAFQKTSIQVDGNENSEIEIEKMKKLEENMSNPDEESFEENFGSFFDMRERNAPL